MADVVGPWVDNHCHLGMTSESSDGPDAKELLASADAAGVVAMIDVGTDAASSRRCLESAARLPGVFATAGVHPHEAVQGTAALAELVEEHRDSEHLVAIGECGLDHHYDHSPPRDQRHVFAEQIAMAHELDLPLVIHTREAWDDTFEILDAEGAPSRTVFHCFTGGPREAERCLERSAWLSVSGIVTFRSAEDVRSAVRSAPLSALMVETDAPFLTPVPFRGRTNVPANVALVGAEVARLQGSDVAEVAAVTTANADSFYGLGLA